MSTIHTLPPSRKEYRHDQKINYILIFINTLLAVVAILIAILKT